MPELAIHLLGRPRVEVGGVALPAPRGHKPWGLLAYVLCSERPPTRDELVAQLFGEADDPLGALRWNLSALRRVLPGTELEGDPLTLRLPPGTWVDIEVLRRAPWVEAVAVPDIERELLEGMSFGASPAFEIWLVSQRRHLAALAEAVLREAALARLGAGDAEAAVELASRLVRLNALDEGFQTLLVRSLAAAGDAVGAAQQVARCRALFARELGREPSAALTAAGSTPSPTATRVSGRAAARAQLEAGEAAIAAGALDAGLECLRRAVADARTGNDLGTQAEALLALGSALVHAARGRDEEAAAALHEVLAIADRADVGPVAAAASRELGYVEYLRARYERADAWLERAELLAGEDAAQRGHIASVRGSVLTDTAHYPEALDQLRRSVALSEDAGDRRRVAYTTTMLGRCHLLRGELEEAAAALEEGLARAREEAWTAFTPWPQALRGDVDLLRGDVEQASERFEHAFALGCQIGDPCWEGAGARGIGLVAAARGEVHKALEWLADARRRCARLPDAYLWVEAYTLEALCGLAVARGLSAACAWVAELEELTARTGMRDLAVRACLHRARAGDDSALAAAGMLAAGIESPALDALLAGAAVAVE